MDSLDEDAIRMVERVVIVRLSTKHINIWMRQIEMKRSEILELAELMGLEGVKSEVEKEKSLETWAKRCTHFFTKKVKRMLFEEIDNTVWSGNEEEISGWCKRNKVFDEITEEEIEEIWEREKPGDGKPIRLNGKHVWETSKRVCDFIDAHEDLIHITALKEYTVVMLEVMMVIKEAHNVERKRRLTSRNEKIDETRKGSIKQML